MGDEEVQGEDVIRPTAEEVATLPPVKYEYLDHPADVQIHAWGDDLREAYEQAATGMFGYMTELESVEMVEVREVEAEADAEDFQGLLFHFLDECLFVFSCDPYFITRKVVITDWEVGGGGGGAEGAEGRGEGMMKVRAKLYGEEFRLGKHPQGSEVKAITYASMQVHDKPGQHEVFVIVDI
ncbi:Protein archease-like [Chionoecetes opilio]|uniref:Protein archease-like n=1 Tax=Chionoecetes opilio TaxID=41210 RepID=A0A8J4Y3U5_CHIOP|nr:Protein archease-like [Chionoecetes opilio]